jgi:predicted nucleotide-binding protein (sugar kinase/HSP70/actin superfamily)
MATPGDAGTKTRVGAFLHCVREDLAASDRRLPRAAERLTVRNTTLRDISAAHERVLIPTMSDATEVFASALRGLGMAAEVLPEPGALSLHLGRRHTSGKECLPMILTLGSLLERLERERASDERFAFVMPGTDGPCRFGAYKEMHQLVLERLGWTDRVRIWSPPFGDYFSGVPPGLGTIVLAGVVSLDVLRDLRHDARPREIRAGAADALYRHHLAAIVRLVEREAQGDLSGQRTLREAATGCAWGLPNLLACAACDFAAIRARVDLPVVLVTGEIYLRNVPASNGDVVGALERRGICAKVSGVSEFLQYSDFIGLRLKRRTVGERLDTWVRRRIETVCHAAAARPGEPVPPHVKHVVAAAGPWVRDALEGEAVLTVGASVRAWRSGEVDGVISVGPLECMSNKIAETQLVHVAEQEHLLSLTLSLNGDPIDPEALDAFALAVHAHHAARTAIGPSAPPFARPLEPRPFWEPDGLAA